MPRETATHGSGVTQRSADWPRTANRWVQLTLAEDDPAHFDLDFWVGLMRDTRANAVCMSAGGYIAYYPTAIPFHYRSRFLGETDPFGAIVDSARQLEMHVMARVDPHAIHADAAEAHPEWLARDQDGKPLEHWSFPGIWLTCPFSPYHREFITDVARELVRDYDIDAIFANRWEGHGGISYSEHARRGFRDDTGFDLPVRAGDTSDPAWQAYVPWRRRRLSELVAIWDDAVREIRPHARFIPNIGSLGVRDMDRDLIQRHYPLFFIDKQGRSGNEAPWSAGRNGKRNRGLFRDRPVGLITSVGPEHHEHRWKDAVSPPEETRTWIVDGFAQGAFPWFTKFNATISDDRWVRPVVEAFTLHAALDPVLGPLPITAEVALLDPTQTDRLLTPADRRERFSHEDGFYQALVEARIPFEFVADQVLSAEELSRFRVLVLANAERLSDAQCATVAAWVESGGSLVMAYQSSLLDETGQARDTFGLAGTIGVDLAGSTRGPVKNNYVALTGQHRLHAGLDGAKRIIGGTRLLPIVAHADTDVPFRFIPDFPDLPMEEVYPRAGPDAPAVVARELPSGGRVVYIGFDIGSLFWEALQDDHGRLIANAVNWALRDDPRVRVEGPGLVDIAVREGEREVAVTLVNLTNPMAMRGAIRETIPLTGQRVTVRLPEGTGTVGARLLVADRAVDVTVQDGHAVVDIPSLDLLEVVHLTWGQE
ncbi:MAG: beta-galactosidase [uncultured Thermomicrobiales bacterium]|uniref:Beta-galactosidase n=1 Tax=uncultured Thermomicrobiales bacterium TaxID=1645740 RepID=A0A6J4VAL6_9BACT|nr:MAG: beta-galactosidase [uncultured Thermomicrobiales bacterium]